MAMQHTVEGVPARLTANACLTVSRPGLPCDACSTNCPEKSAIQTSERSVRIDPAACSGCGRCAAACPTGAINVAGFAPAPRLECSRVGRPEGAVVPCLGGVGADDLRNALVDGDVTLLDRGWCAECPTSGQQAAPWADAVAIVNTEMVELGLAHRVQVERLPVARWRAVPAPSPPTTNPARRAFFNKILKSSGERGQPSTGPEKVETPGPKKRAAQLAQLAGNTGIARTLFPAFRVFGHVPDLVALVRLCPTTALDLVEGPSSRALAFDPIACIDCGTCVTMGLMERVTKPEGSFAGPETLTSEPRATCTQCRARFTPEGGRQTCLACARDTALAASVHGLMRHNQSQERST